MMLLRINRTVCKRVRVNVKLLTATKSTTSSDKAKNQKLIDALKNVPKPTRPRNSMSSDETKKYQNPFDALKNVRARPPKPQHEVFSVSSTILPPLFLILFQALQELQ